MLHDRRVRRNDGRHGAGMMKGGSGVALLHVGCVSRIVMSPSRRNILLVSVLLIGRHLTLMMGMVRMVILEVSSVRIARRVLQMTTRHRS